MRKISRKRHLPQDLERPLAVISAKDLGKQYRNLMRIISAISVDINTAAMSATLHLKQLEPDTVVTLHEVVFGMPESADGSSQSLSTVGSSIILSDKNCPVVKDAANHSFNLQVDLRKICPMAEMTLSRYKGRYVADPRPEYIRLSVSVDLYGDKTMVIPDDTKKVIAERYAGGKVTLKIE